MNVYDGIKLIQKNNFLTSDKLKIGDILYISSNNNDASTVSTNTTPSSTDKIVTYVVKEKDSLVSLCKTYAPNCPVAVAQKTIMQFNDLATDKLSVGKTIKIPYEYFNKGEKYTIKTGDTISGIAKSYFPDKNLLDTSKKIIKDNFLSNDSIKVGNELFIPHIELDEIKQ
jgi:LysM repeat protein